MRPPRAAIRVPVRYRVIGEEGWREGVTENISRAGVLIRVPQFAPLGADLDVVLSVPPGIFTAMAGEIICTGSVIRHAPDSAGAAGIGVMFRRCRPTTASLPSGR